LSYTAREADDIANLAFVGGKTNQAIKDKPPAIYLPPLVEQQGSALFDAQAIPLDAELLELKNYKAFLAERRNRIASMLSDFLKPSA
jgi:hypothetical protein